ncbi:hypothetical protein BU26DRAFT_433513, partial [Trematosphaeria pertusa]
AIPILKALAANDNLRNYLFRRFKRDDPPLYALSTKLEEFNNNSLTPLLPLLRGELLEELKAIIEQLISDDKIKHIAFNIGSIIDPVDFYYTEAKREED